MEKKSEEYLLVAVDTTKGFCIDVTATLKPSHKSKGYWRSLKELETERAMAKERGELWDLTLLVRIHSDSDSIQEVLSPKATL